MTNMTEHKCSSVNRKQAESAGVWIANSLMNKGVYVLYLIITLLAMLAISAIPARADSITIGRGSGVVWEGMPFSGTLSGPLAGTTLGNFSLISVGTSISKCDFLGVSALTINGIQGLQLAPGVILVPRLSVNGYFTRYSGETATFSGTIGLPANAMYLGNGKNMAKGNVGPWCFSPEGTYSTDMLNYYSATGPRVINYSGTWVVMADGTQTSTNNIALPAFYIGSYILSGGLGNIYTQVLPTSLNMRVSTLACTIATTTAINFGNVQRNSQSGAELANLTYPLTTSCTQPADMVNANINVQFRAISGNYNSTASWLSLTQGGGYITGEINNGVTGSGICKGTSGIPFNNTQLKVGNITNAENSKTISNLVTWRLCSGGASLPTGAVDASAEMLVTFN